MNKNFFFLLAIISITIFSIPNITLKTITNSDFQDSQKNESDNQSYEDIVDDTPTNIENLKTADTPQSNLNFSFDTSIDENWNSTFYFENYTNFMWMEIDNTQGYNATFEIFITGLINGTTGDPINLSDLPDENRSIIYINRGGGGVGIPIPDNGHIQPRTDSFSLIYGIFFWFHSGRQTTYDIRFNATVYLNSSRNSIVTTTFVPDNENTKSEKINWEFNFPGFIPGDYNATLEVENFSNFTINRVLGNENGYWRPINYSTTFTQILINESYSEYFIELQTLNYISIIYNDNLTVANNELRLWVSCQMEGNLTIEFTDVNGITYKNKTEVENNELIFFNYIMSPNSTGGKGFLNVTLLNSSKTFFGIKFAEIAFFKEAFIYAFTSNTTAFSEFYVIAPYLDKYLWDDLLSRNQSEHLELTIFDVLNYSKIDGATITYELEDISGELDEFILPINESGIVYNTSLYFKVIDLREYLIPPGEYNLTFRATKSGYSSLEFIAPLYIFKKEVLIDVQVTPPDKIFTIEEAFALTMSMHVFYPHYENFLRVPVNLSIDIWRGTVLDDHFEVPNVVQSLTLQDVIGNDSIPGDYTLNITIVSEYYEGNVTIDVKIQKKVLDLSVVYDNEVDEDEDFDIIWSLENGNFTGNRENMTLEIYLDGRLISTVNLTATNASSGIITLKLDKGDYTVTYRLISPFYEVERIIAIEAVGGKSEKEEPSWLEENWPLLLLLILAVIAMSVLGVYMTISRRRVRAQRELDSELVALKTRLAATEDNISLIQTQISEIAGIYWILVIHSEQGTTMVEITEFRFNEVLGEEFKVFVEEGMIRDSALIGGFLTAIRNFSRETAGESHEYQPIFNSQTDYSTIANDKEVHRRILEGSSYFMAFISARGTMEISEVLSAVNSKFHGGYGEAAKEFLGKVTVFNPFKEEVATLLQNEIIELQKKLEDGILLRQHYERHLKQVQEKIGIKKIK